MRYSLFQMAAWMTGFCLVLGVLFDPTPARILLCLIAWLLVRELILFGVALNQR